MAKNEIRIKFKIEGPTNESVIGNVLSNRSGWVQASVNDSDWDLFWCDLTQIKEIVDLRNLKSHQKVSHFRNFFELSRKSNLARNLKKYRKQCVKVGDIEAAEMCNAMPVTFEIPNEMHLFQEETRRNPGVRWIVKPSVGSRGRGIFLFKKMSQFTFWKNNKDWAPKERKKNDDPENVELVPEIWIVQKYISNPYLLGGKKFDLRIYVLVTSFSPLTVWMARDGFSRVAGVPYSKNKLEDSIVHLTNTSIQLSDENSTQGFKWSIQNLRLFLTSRHGRNRIDELFQKIGKVVITALKSVGCMQINNNRNCFELYGFDVLLTDDLHVCLLEINAAPSMTATDDGDYLLKYNLIDDVLNVLDLEGKLTGKEIRVGGFDKFWCDGPIYQVCKGVNSSRNIHITNRLYNLFLGCINDREKQLKEMAKWTALYKSIF